MIDITLKDLSPEQVIAVQVAVQEPLAVLSKCSKIIPDFIAEGAEHSISRLSFPSGATVSSNTTAESMTSASGYTENGAQIDDPVMDAKLRAEAQEKASHVGAVTLDAAPSAEDIFGTKTDSTPVATAAPTGVVQDVQPQTAAPTTGAGVASTVATASPSSEVDSAGMPWDARIHTANKSTVKAGTWKYKPKTDKALIAQIEKDYRDQGFGTPTTAEPEPQQAAPAATVMPGVQPTAPAQAQVAQVVAQAPTESGVTFPMIVTQITMGISGNKFTAADVSELLSKYGLSSSGELSVREDLLQPFWNDLEVLANG